MERFELGLFSTLNTIMENTKEKGIKGEKLGNKKCD